MRRRLLIQRWRGPRRLCFGAALGVASLALLSVPAAGEDIRLCDNTRLNAMIEEAVPTTEPALRVTTMDGQVKTIPLSDIITINFRGRENRMLLAGTQELRLINDDRIRGRFVRNQGDALVLDTACLGEFTVNLSNVKGFVTLPQVGRAGRWAEEALDEKPVDGQDRFLDQVIDRRGSVYKGVIRQFSEEGIDIDHEAMLKVVPIPTLYLAGGRMAQESQKPAPPFPSEVLLRITTRDGSRIDGRLEKIALDRWQVRPAWDPQVPLQVRAQEITAVQVLNSKRLYLSQLTPLRIKEATVIAPPQPYRMDRSCQGDALTIGSHSYPWGIGVHANSELTFHLGKTFKTFQAVVGIDSHCGSEGSVVFSVLGDGKQLYKSPLVRGSDAEPREVSVPVQGVEELTLKVDDGGDQDLGDVANWGLAQLLR